MFTKRFKFKDKILNQALFFMQQLNKNAIVDS